MVVILYPFSPVMIVQFFSGRHSWKPSRPERGAEEVGFLRCPLLKWKKLTFIVLWLYHIISTLNLEIDGNSIFLKANARILGWMDGWMDGGWWTRLLCSWWLDSHPSYVATNLLQVSCPKMADLVAGAMIKKGWSVGPEVGMAPLCDGRGENGMIMNDKPQWFWGCRIFGQTQ